MTDRRVDGAVSLRLFAVCCDVTHTEVREREMKPPVTHLVRVGGYARERKNMTWSPVSRVLSVGVN